ncbi:hypothetical protein FHS95_001284 [Sphingomonas naasensis]|uniref:Uncharacterized protein n=1 Tax=Sphingomonas naasensis TaxID=1344951 RepID=A0A4S1W7T2_9SPHN|nr:hypothetical protein [Sphingomonas naasensis]NIJ19615.1 hypothetical protein [Sphingomonas naasensis]TGX37307.1 hypothetical protein E5A74_20405 [Sphingomonas naasensis]
MPIAVVATVEIVIAAVLTIWTLIFGTGDVDTALACAALGLGALNALAILRILRRPDHSPLVAGLWTATMGGLLLLAIGSAPLWIDLAFPPADNFLELLVPIVHGALALAALALAALATLLVGWGMVALRRWQRRRQAV